MEGIYKNESNFCIRMVRLWLFLQEFTLMLLCWFYEKTALGDVISRTSFFDVYLAILLPYNISKSQLGTLPLCMASWLANIANIYAVFGANI